MEPYTAYEELSTLDMEEHWLFLSSAFFLSFILPSVSPPGVPSPLIIMR